MTIEAKIIFIGGIHGVGKGVFCHEFMNLIEINYLSASELIKWTDISNNKAEKKVDDIDSTQMRLINALNSNCEKSKNYILDGHYSLLDKNNRPKIIDRDVFYSINPLLFIVLKSEPEIIKTRLAIRDGNSYDISLISEMQDLEISYSREIAHELNKPHLIMTSLDDLKLQIEFIKHSL
jgi:adenylate kinase